MGQHSHVNRLDLVGQGADARETYGEMAVVCVSQSYSCRFDHEAEALTIRRPDPIFRSYSTAHERLHLGSGKNRFIRRTVGKTYPALESSTKRTHRLDDNWLREMAGQVYPLADGIFGLFHFARRGHICPTYRSRLGKPHTWEATMTPNAPRS